MTDVTCVRCQTAVAARLVDYLEDGAVCRSCLVAASSDPLAIANSERALMVSMGRRSLLIGVVMLAIGIAVLALGVSGGTVILVPVGLLAGGVVEIVRGVGKLSG